MATIRWMRTLISGLLFALLWSGGAILGYLRADLQDPSAFTLVPSVQAQAGAMCRVGTTFESNTVENWTVSSVDTSGNPPITRIRPGGPPPSQFYYHLKDASGASTLNASNAFLGDVMAGLAGGCRRQLCFDVNLFNDGDNSGSPNFPPSFYIDNVSVSPPLRASFASTAMISEPAGANPGWHRICADFPSAANSTGWRLFDMSNPNSPVQIATPTAAQWSSLLAGVTAIRFPVDWSSSFQTEEVGYDNFCISDQCECVAFAETRVACANGPSGPSGCYTVSTIVTNNTGQTVSFAMVAPTSGGSVTPNVIPLVPPLGAGQSRPISFTLCPPANATVASVDVSLAGPGGEPCCRRSLRFELPSCPQPECLWVPKSYTSCIAGAAPGTFNLWFNYRNMTNCPTSLYLLAGPPESVTASYFAGGLAPFTGTGPTYNIPVKVSGATSSTFCMIISQQCKEGGNCCSRKVCFPVPNCWPSPMPSPTPDKTPLDASAEEGH